MADIHSNTNRWANVDTVLAMVTKHPVGRPRCGRLGVSFHLPSTPRNQTVQDRGQNRLQIWHASHAMAAALRAEGNLLEWFVVDDKNADEVRRAGISSICDR